MSHELPDSPVPGELPPFSPVAIPSSPEFQHHRPPRRRFQDRVWKHVLLLVLTICTTTFVGASSLRLVRERFRSAGRIVQRCAVARRVSLQRSGAADPRRARDGPLPVLPALQRRRIAAVLHSTADVPTGTLGSRDQDPGDVPERARFCSTSASQARLPASSPCCRCSVWGMALSHVVPRPDASRAASPSANRFSSDSFRG